MLTLSSQLPLRTSKKGWTSAVFLGAKDRVPLPVWPPVIANVEARMFSSACRETRAYQTMAADESDSQPATILLDFGLGVLPSSV